MFGLRRIFVYNVFMENATDILPSTTTPSVQGMSDADGVVFAPQAAPPAVTVERTWIHILKYVFFAAGAGIIQVAVFTLLNEVVHLEYWLSYLVALACSVLFNFTLNRKYTFKAANNVPLAMTLAFLFYLPFAPYSTWLEHYLTGKAWNEYLVLLVNMVQNLILEFLWYQFVVFRKNNKEKLTYTASKK